MRARARITRGDVLAETKLVVAAARGESGRTLLWVRERGTHQAIVLVGSGNVVEKVLLETSSKDCAQALFDYERDRVREAARATRQVRISPRGNPIRGGAAPPTLPFIEYRIRPMGPGVCEILALEHRLDGSIRQSSSADELAGEVACRWAVQEAMEAAGRWLQSQWDSGYHKADFRIIDSQGRVIEEEEQIRRLRSKRRRR